MIYSNRDLAQKLERAEAKTNASFVETRAKMFPESNAEWTKVAGTYAMFDGVESPITQTFGLGVFEEITVNDLEKIEMFFKKHDAPVFHEVSPLIDLSLLELLNKRGYQPIELSSVLYLPLEENDFSAAPKTENLTTRVIEQIESELWAQTSADGWTTEAAGLADFIFEFGKIGAASDGAFPFFAELEEKPIATGSLFIHDDVALLAGASTVSEGRRKGAQNALLNARLKFAREKNCKIAMMAAAPGSQSQRNAESNGFRIAYTRIKWHLEQISA